MTASQQMPLFVGTKTVHATPMTRQAYNDYRAWALPADENGDDAGFLVEYVDGGKSNDARHVGYISWSPAEVFARSYRAVDLATKVGLQAEIDHAAAAHNAALAALAGFDALIENNVFATLDDAAGTLEDALRDEASADCEGSHNCGAEQYQRHFLVDGVEYIGTLTVEYNRHDKTYYYVDGAKFTYARAPEPARAAG